MAVDLKALRKRLGLTQAQVSVMTGISQPRICDIENRAAPCMAHHALWISEALGFQVKPWEIPGLDRRSRRAMRKLAGLKR